MNEDMIERLRGEERDEEVRHDELYASARPAASLQLVADDWEKFDTAEPSRDAYISSVQRLGDLRGATVLDYGCGTGWLSVILAKRGALRVDGFDISGEAVKDARERAQQNGVSEVCRFKRGSCYEIPFDDEAYDIVTGQAILHHLQNKDVAARELRRVMKPGAKAVFYEPLGNSRTFERFRRLLPIPSDADDPDHWMDKLTIEHVESFRQYFVVDWQEFELTVRLGRYFPRMKGTLERFDRFLIDHVPGARRFARGIVIEMTK